MKEVKIKISTGLHGGDAHQLCQFNKHGGVCDTLYNNDNLPKHEKDVSENTG